MEKGICAAVSEDTALGLFLAGIHDIFIYRSGSSEEELRKWYHERIGDAEVGVMVLSIECGEAISRELFERRVSGELLPVTVIIPGEKEDKRASELIKRAIGMDPGKDVQGSPIEKEGS